MSYLVLARKWRPKRFAELVGQEHVVRALGNALDSGRVHHAFLFTGTRGVGKTTIARIFAKSLNCERGTSAEPCGECETCRAVDAGRFIDLLEIDAASNTGVDDVRELIDNAQYMPSRGRVKVYLIDEVHMLSKNAFNALLKTLEEPPEHVKFLLATTDPQKLPVTVLSRCLQFNLKRLDEAQIGGQIEKILGAEGFGYEAGAVAQIAKGADGSLRDGLSLLDQAIAYAGAGDGQALTDAAVAAMLGSVDRTRIGALLAALADGDGSALLAEVDVLAGFSPDWSSVLEATASALHRVQLRQLVPSIAVDEPGIAVDALAARLKPELVQLWYQMAIDGRRDLGYAPSPRSGFEMSVLRMLAFRPVDAGGDAVDTAPAPATARGPAAARAALDAGTAAPAARAEQGDPVRRRVPIDDPTREPAAASPTPTATAAPGPARAPARASALLPDTARATAADAAQPASPAPATPPAVAAPTVDAERWPDIVAGLPLRGPDRELAQHVAFVGYADGVLRLSLPASEEHLRSPLSVDQLARALAAPLGVQPQIRFDAAPAAGETLHARTTRERDARQSAAHEAFMADPQVQRLVAQGARVVPDSIRPYDD